MCVDLQKYMCLENKHSSIDEKKIMRLKSQADRLILNAQSLALKLHQIAMFLRHLLLNSELKYSSKSR